MVVETGSAGMAALWDVVGRLILLPVGNGVRGLEEYKKRRAGAVVGRMFRVV